MYLKSMTIFGFKSFATKSTLTFTPGVAAIVGPNGCGKSNIADAIKWALGESSARPLRGASMQDVIFSGTKTRRGLGLAEVSLVFDNSDKLLPLDFEEVTITRKLFKSGESEFSLNGVNCRLKDILDVFTGTGLGREAYSVIEQGKVDALLSAKPEDRRAVFDEAAGIMKYKVRKRESERKLQDVYANKIRIEDLVSELDRQLPEVASQAELAQRYGEISREISELELSLHINDVKAYHEKFSEISSKLLSLADKEQEMSFKVTEKDALLESGRLELLKSDTQLEEVHSKLAEAKTKIEREDGNYNLLQERLTSLMENQRRIEGERDNLDKERYGALEEYETLKANCDLEAKLLQDQMKQVKELEDKYLSFQEKSVVLSKELESYKANIFDISSKIADLNNRKISITSQSEGLSFRLKRLLASYETKQKELEELSFKRQTLDDSLQKMKGQIEEKKKLLDAYTSQEEMALSSKNLISKELETLKLAQNKANATSQALSNLESSYEGYTKAIKHLFGEYKGKDKGLLGTISELIDVPQGYEVALEAALGGAIQNIVAQTSLSAEDAISSLKASGSGRATFLPLDIISTYRLSKDEIPSNEKGYLGVASEIARCDKAHLRAVEHLLGRCVIVQSLKDAVDIRRKGFKCKMVTLEGEILSAGGAMTGGMSNDRSSTGLLSRKNKIKEIKETLKELSLKILNNEEKLSEQETKLLEIRSLREALNKELSAFYLEEKSFEERNIGFLRDVSRMEEELVEISEEIESIETGKTDSSRSLEVIAEEIKKLEIDKKNIEVSYDKNQADYADFSSEETKIQQSLTEVRVLFAEKKAAHSSMVRDLSRIKDSIETFDNKQKSYEEEIIKIDESIEILKGQAKNILADHDRLLTLQEGIEKELDEQRTKRQKISDDISKGESEIKSLRRSLTNTTEQLRKLEIEKTRVLSDLEHLQEKLVADYSLEVKDVLAMDREKIDRQEVLSRVSVLNEELLSLGPINHGAVEEHKSLKERYDFLIYQLNDLETASESLREVIKEIERTCRKQFLEVYAKIRVEFKEIYVKLFGGGEAELQLTNEEDPLEGGVEIICQPPGKKLTSLSLLSGGERALTAIALLFAIMRLRPSSFCVLDEIDSALDEANVDRFRDLIREFSEDTQILLVTHRKGTMESADYIYGVTMEEFGVSKIFSVSPGK